MIHYYNRTAESTDGSIGLTEQVMCWQNQEEIDGSEVTDARVSYSSEEVDCPRCLSILENAEKESREVLVQIEIQTFNWTAILRRLDKYPRLMSQIQNIHDDVLELRKKLAEIEKNQLPHG